MFVTGWFKVVADCKLCCFHCFCRTNYIAEDAAAWSLIITYSFYSLTCELSVTFEEIGVLIVLCRWYEVFVQIFSAVSLTSLQGVCHIFCGQECTLVSTLTCFHLDQLREKEDIKGKILVHTMQLIWMLGIWVETSADFHDINYSYFLTFLTICKIMLSWGFETVKFCWRWTLYACVVEMICFNRNQSDKLVI